MIIARAPLRISIGGGGTDLASYYSRFGGFFISAAIDQYVYLSLHQSFQKNFIIKYSKMETVEQVTAIQHPIVREVLQKHGMEPRLELASMADIPAGTGLGSSGSFTVSLLKAIYAYKRRVVPVQELAEEACEIEIERLKEPIGKQDPYIAAFGGINCFSISKDGQVSVSPLKIPAPALQQLEENLLLFFTGFSRSASAVLADQKTRSEKNEAAMIDNLHFVKELGQQIRTALESGDTGAFADLMHKHWEHKKTRSASISNPVINDWYDLGFANGARGGKLIGAGGGGFLMFYASDRAKLRETMARQGLQEIRFRFDFEGAKVVTL